MLCNLRKKNIYIYQAILINISASLIKGKVNINLTIFDVGEAIEEAGGPGDPNFRLLNAKRRWLGVGVGLGVGGGLIVLAAGADWDAGRGGLNVWRRAVGVPLVSTVWL